MKRRIALALFTEPFLFPPTLHAASVLLDADWEVDLIGLRIDGVPRWALKEGINLCYFGDVKRGVRLRQQHITFWRKLRRKAREKRYQAIIGYDFMGAFLAYSAAKTIGATFIYHNHDLLMKEDTRWFFYRSVKLLELHAARHADTVVFPQRKRAEIFRNEARLVSDPVIAANCPREEWIIQRGTVPDHVFYWREKVGHIVLYQGGFLVHRGILSLIDSMKYWSFRGGLLMVGLPLEAGIVETMKQRATEAGTADRLMVLPPLPHDELPALMNLADVGVGVLRAGDAALQGSEYVNLRYLAGASNKVFEYMAAGLPVVSCSGGGFEELIKEPQHGFCCDGDSAEQIAVALNKVFEDRERYHNISNNNREAFLKKYNYDIQFRPVLDCLERRIG